MQNIVFYVAGNEMLGVVKDYANAKNVNPPSLVRTVGCTLKLRLFLNADGEDPYPLSLLQNVTAWSWIMDSDFDGTTTPKLQADAGQISIATVTENIDGDSHTYTEFTLPMSDMNTQELATWLGTAESKSGLHGELSGVDSNGDTVFVLQVKNFTVRNRIGTTGDPTEIVPDYLTAVQVRGLVAAGVVNQFSADGTNWHDTQATTDKYFRQRSASDVSSAWSNPIKLPDGAKGDKGDPGTNGSPGQNGVGTYTYVAFAEDDEGTGFSTTQADGLIYRAEIQVHEPIAEPALSDFANAAWVQYIFPNSGGGGSGDGDMKKSVYDTNNNGKVDAAESADKLSTSRNIGSASFDGSSDITLQQMGAAPTSHTHAISNVTDLQSTLNGKAASSHSHAISDVTNLQTTLSGKAASSHSHAVSDVTGLQTALNGKAASSHSHAISDVTDLQSTLNGKLEGVSLNGEAQAVADKVVNIMALPIATTMPSADATGQNFMLYLGTSITGDEYVGQLRTYQQQGDGVMYLDLSIVDATATGTSRVWTGYNYMDNTIRIRYNSSAWIIERKYMGEDEPFTQIGTLTLSAANGQPWGDYTVSSSTWTFTPVTACNPALKCHLYERNEAWNSDILLVKAGSGQPVPLFRVGNNNTWNTNGTPGGDDIEIRWQGTDTGYWTYYNGFEYRSPVCPYTTMPWELSGVWTYPEDDASITLDIQRQFTGGWSDLGAIVTGGNQSA